MRDWKRSVPNCITSLRILGTFLLLFFEPGSDAFLIVYALCGLTDVLDGAAARMLNAVSASGSRLDSISDLLFYSLTLIRVLPVIWSDLSTVTLLFAALVILLRISAYIVAAVKYHVFTSMHTYGNKATGFFVFLIPIVTLTLHWNANVVCMTVLVIALLATLEELLIHLTSPTYMPDRKAIWQKIQEHTA